jgi:DNA helicase-2/ATP-dependent DNA helicase PcrA
MPFDPTDEQQAILRHNPQRHARVLAGPGTGKSTTMVALLDQLLQADNNLRVRMLTFTRAATQELAEKIATQTQQPAHPSTIHSFAISVLLRNPGTAGFPEPLRIADTWETKNIVRPTLAKRCRVGVRLLDKLLQEMASNWESLTDDIDPELSDADRVRFRGAWGEHRRVLGYTLLNELPFALRRALQDHDDLHGIDYDLLVVDEYQDLNACELEVLKLLAEKGGCALVATGDDDQSIYSWRKAAPVGIRRFPDDYEPTDDYSLSTTLRCGKRIIEWANYVIQGDPDRPPDRGVLEPLDSSPDGEVALLSFARETTEVNGVVAIVKGLMSEGMDPKDILILTRSDNNGAFSRPIRESLEEQGIPCSDPSAIVTLLANQANRQLLEVLRLAVNREDSLAWAALLHLEPGVGESFFDYIYNQAKQQGNTFAQQVLRAHADDYPEAPSSAQRAKQLLNQILPWLGQQETPDEQPEVGWGAWIIEQVQQDNPLAAPSEAFSNLLTELDKRVEDDVSLEQYLGQIEPLGRDIAQAHGDGVRIMTMGGAKGLTVRATIIVGVEDGLVPRPESDLSEERRLLYVGMTRSKEFLFCTWAKRRQGPTARAGAPSSDRRRHSHFLNNGPVQSQAGQVFLTNRFD